MATLFRVVVSAGALLVLLLPAYLLAGRLLRGTGMPFLRLLLACGLALVGHLSFVNLAGRLSGDSIDATVSWLALNAAASLLVLARHRHEVTPGPLARSWREWLPALLAGLVLALPQWILAVSTNYWDEAASSAIHLTGPNQFAEGVFPPRHNALPEVPTKYHYGFIILSGTVRWITGLSANVSVDIVSTTLWLFVLLFAYFWLRELRLGAVASAFGAISTLLGGGYAWLVLPRIEAYSGHEKIPQLSQLLHRFDPARGWWENLLAVSRVPSLHLRNADGTISNLPWDIAAQFQQHAVALGIALTLLAFHLVTLWLSPRSPGRLTFTAVALTFGVLLLGHAVFGAMAVGTAALYLFAAWARHRTRAHFARGLAFGISVPALAFLHGGMLFSGPEYGGGGFSTLRSAPGYSNGGLRGFLEWNLFGFGALLALALVAVALHRRRRDPAAEDRNRLFALLAVFAGVSYAIPQVMFYSSDTYGIEQFTEISKFFFCTHLGFALLAGFGLFHLPPRVRFALAAPALLVGALLPVAFCWAASVDKDGNWLGFYRAPYYRDSVEEQMGRALGAMKEGPKESYFDAAGDERRHGYLSEMLIFGGSVFTLTPSRFERTGIGFRLSEQVVAERFVHNSRMARLRPGAPEEARCRWYYLRPASDLARAPVIVRSRFEKLVREGLLRRRHEVGPRALYSFDGPTAELDDGLERYWSPRLVSQTLADCDGDGRKDLVFLDLAGRRILCNGTAIPLPDSPGETSHLLVAHFPGERKLDFLLGRMMDTEFRLGKRIEDVVEQSGWAWTYRDSHSAYWQPEYRHWYWDHDIPFIADLDHDGVDSHLAYRTSNSQWFSAPNRPLEGPKLDPADLPRPFGGRFLAGSAGDLGLWSLRTGTVALRSLTTGETVSFKWGGRPGDILVPGDYDGDGFDEIAVWQRTNRTWYWRRAPDGPISQASFGTETSIPVPADFDHDGRLDLAYWEPEQGTIFVSFDRGRTIARVLTVPAGALPAFVNWD